MSDSLQPYRLQPPRLLCPWDFPGKNTGVDCHALLQGIFLTQGSNLCLLCLLRWQVCSLPLVPRLVWRFYYGPIHSAFELKNWLGFYLYIQIVSKKLLVVLGWVCRKERIGGYPIQDEISSYADHVSGWDACGFKTRAPIPSWMTASGMINKQIWQIHTVLRMGIPLGFISI